MRTTIVTAAVALACMVQASRAQGPAPPELVVDVSTGAILRGRDPDRAWRPASLTKLMTTYVALRQVASGRLRPDVAVTVSRHAAAAPPSRSGIPVGGRLLLADALRVLMVKSANDVAVAVAETVSGDEAAFAALMNAESARLGMASTHWVNPHGLDAPGQATTARDLAILARAIRREFPSMDGLFSIGAISLRGTVMTNHNGAIGRYGRSDGMKTGFTCGAGFNVVSTATLGGRRVVAVVLGRAAPNERDARASLLLEAALLAPVPAGSSLVDGPRSDDPRPVPTVGCGGRARGEDDIDADPGAQEWVRAFSRTPRALGQPVAVNLVPAAAPENPAPAVAGTLRDVVSSYRPPPGAPSGPGPASMAAAPSPAAVPVAEPVRTRRF